MDAVASDLLGDISDLPGRIDNAGDVDRFRIASPEALPDVPRDTVFAAAANAATERYILRLTRFAFGMDAIVRVTTSSGTKEYATGPLAYDEYWILPLDLAAGEVVTVDAQHKNGQSAAGQYDISFGKPLLGEPAGATLYLPHVRRQQAEHAVRAGAVPHLRPHWLSDLRRIFRICTGAQSPLHHALPETSLCRLMCFVS